MTTGERKTYCEMRFEACCLDVRCVLPTDEVYQLQKRWKRLPA